MTISAATLRKLMDAGLQGKALLDVVESIEADITKPSRTAGAERQRRYRERHRNVTSNVTGDVTTPPLPDKERSPLHPPKEINPSPPPLSEAIASSSETRVREIDQSELEFAREFWPAYPNKVGKPAALRAWRSARKRSDLGTILEGLARYKTDKPPDRPWLNPATFLNQERWNDEPAVVEIRPRNAPDRPHDAIFGALARRFEECDRDDQWQAHPHVRLVDHR